MDLITIQNC